MCTLMWTVFHVDDILFLKKQGTDIWNLYFAFIIAVIPISCHRKMMKERMAAMTLKINKNRIARDLETLKSFNSCPEQEGITRMLFSDAEIAARDYVKSLMDEAGLIVSEDAIGNIYGVLAGSEPALPPVWSGSHIDTVRNGGMYDGTVGVMGAIEACRSIRENALAHRRSIVVVVFASEEPTRFGIGCIGSRAMAGHLSLEDTRGLIDEQGISLYDELDRLGYTELDYEKTVVKKTGDVFASVELHIEQAPLLEQIQCPIGIVEAVCAPTYIQVILEGQQEHAGSTPMHVRRDAMVAASKIVVELENLALAHGNEHTVATIGRLLAFPNSSNVIAGKVEFFIDIRDIDEKIKTDLTKKICAYIDTVAILRDLKAHYSVTADDVPHSCSAQIIGAIEKSCGDRGIPAKRMVSGAYHDSLLVAEFAPMGMIFVPSRKGISHDPAEYTDMDDIVIGTEVLADTLLMLSNQEPA